MNSSNAPATRARPLDHVVLPVADLAVARARLSALGFTVAPDGVHPFGTANCCVYLSDGTFVEPLAIGDAKQAAASASDGNVFTARDAAYRRAVGNDGFSALVLTTGDAGADHAAFAKAGLSAGEMLEFSRPFIDAVGAKDTASFRLAFAADRRASDLFLFTCQRLNAPKVDRSALQKHANGATRIARIIVAASEPVAIADLMEAGACAQGNAGKDRAEIRLPNATVVAMMPAAVEAEFGIEIGRTPSPRLVGIVLGVADLSAAEASFNSAGIACIRRNDRLVVPPSAGQGAFFAFEVLK